MKSRKRRAKSNTVKSARSVLELSGIFHEYAVGKTTDWDAIRQETMRMVAEEIAGKSSATESEQDADDHHD